MAGDVGRDGKAQAVFKPVVQKWKNMGMMKLDQSVQLLIDPCILHHCLVAVRNFTKLDCMNTFLARFERGPYDSLPANAHTLKKLVLAK